MLHFYAQSIDDKFEFIPEGQLPAFRRQTHTDGLFRTASDDAQVLFVTKPDNEPPTVQNDADDILTAYIAGNYSPDFDIVIGAMFVASNAHNMTRTYAMRNNDLDRNRNPAGELLAATHAIQFGIKHHAKKIRIMHTYPSVANWAQPDATPKSNTAYQYQKSIAYWSKLIDIEFVQIPRDNLIPAQKYVQAICDWTIGD